MCLCVPRIVAILGSYPSLSLVCANYEDRVPPISFWLVYSPLHFPALLWTSSWLSSPLSRPPQRSTAHLDFEWLSLQSLRKFPSPLNLPISAMDFSLVEDRFLRIHRCILLGMEFRLQSSELSKSSSISCRQANVGKVFSCQTLQDWPPDFVKTTHSFSPSEWILRTSSSGHQ